jgi:hypothetical protein
VASSPSLLASAAALLDASASALDSVDAAVDAAVDVVVDVLVPLPPLRGTQFSIGGHCNQASDS